MLPSVNPKSDLKYCEILNYISLKKEWNRNPVSGEQGFFSKSDLRYAAMSTYHTSEIRKCDEILGYMVFFKLVSEKPDDVYAVNLLDLMESVAIYAFSYPEPKEHDNRLFFFDYLSILYTDKIWKFSPGNDTEMSKWDFVSHFLKKDNVSRSPGLIERIWSLLIDFGCFVETERKGVYRANLPMIREEIKKSNRV